MYRKIITSLAILLMVLTPIPVQGRIKEKVIIFNATTGHDHDGVVGGKQVYLPAIAITDVNVCASQICQLALTAEEGDVCVRTDEDKSYIHNGGVVGDMTDWTLLLSTGLVTSVNSETGAIVNVERTTRIQTTISDSDSNYPSSGAVVDYTVSELSTHSSSANTHHSSTSDTLDITPATVTTTGDIRINSDSSSDQILFGTAGDTALYRGAANQLTTADNVLITEAAITIERTSHFGGINVQVVGDAATRWWRNVNGAENYGDGAGIHDIRLERSTVGTYKIHNGSSGNITKFDVLATNSDFSGAVTVAGASGLSLSAGDLTIASTKGITWGDTDLLRGGANLLKTNDTFQATDIVVVSGGFHANNTSGAAFYTFDNTGGSTGVFLYSDLSSETYARFLVNNSGRMEWGSGTAGRDTTLYRDSANTLKTDDNLVVAGGTITLGTDTSFYRDTSTRISTGDQVSSSLGFRVTGGSSAYVHGTTTKYMGLSAASMQGYGSQPTSVEYSYVRASTADSADDAGQMTVILPHGAIVMAVYAYGSTTASTNSQVRVMLNRVTLSSGSIFGMSDCSFNNTATFCGDTSIGNSTIDTNNYSYFLRTWIKAPSAVTDSRLHSIRITYTVSNMSQTL